MENKVNFVTFLQNAMEITDIDPAAVKAGETSGAAAEFSLSEEAPFHPAERLQEAIRYLHI